MSDYQRKHLLPAEFASLVDEYYRERAPFSESINKILGNLETMPENTENKSASGSESAVSGRERSKLSTLLLEPDVQSGAKSATKATAQDHQASPGPVITENIGKPASREELHKRAEELNK